MYIRDKQRRDLLVQARPISKWDDDPSATNTVQLQTPSQVFGALGHIMAYIYIYTYYKYIYIYIHNMIVWNGILIYIYNHIYNHIYI